MRSINQCMSKNSKDLTEQDIIKTIIRFNNDPDVQQLQSFYFNQTVPEILGVSRREISHSAFLAWLFNPGTNHGLGLNPIVLLLELYLKCYRNQRKEFLDNVQKLPESVQSAILTRDISIIATSIKTEESVAINKQRGRADIVIACDVLIPSSKIKRLSIIIENKIYSKEHSQQTQTYFNFHEANRLRDDNGDFTEFCLYIFLTPSANEEANCISFVRLTYQNLLDHILERLLLQSDLSERTRFILTEYVNSLSIPTYYIDEKNNNKKGKMIMAIGKSERELLQSFWDRYRTLFTAALTAMSTDENASDEEKEIAAKTLKSVQKMEGKKYYKYKINRAGKYNCGQVVVELIKMYVARNSTTTLVEINNTFKKFKNPIAVTLQEATKINKTPNSKGECKKRYFDEFPITLADNNQIAITNQWGNDKRFEGLIEFAKSIIPGLEIDRIQ